MWQRLPDSRIDDGGNEINALKMEGRGQYQYVPALTEVFYIRHSDFCITL
ncbi:hypothetical protein SAMN05216403_10790 [Nitrosospira multiformis ATCC 25196]|uniref:Uncharacterized protein n=1 Tax=Nitrosospira multiformis (strain ATCC 25196 / NCIMB 11849 / C 71) TaxID=323848 RepID=A0A1H5UHH3_NITMU|nr:hypothetical protein SAMN05216403_10790 [Nitrosospira multiformis ATCC 25196]